MTVAETVNHQERRTQSQHIVDELRQERKEVWALYCQIADLKPFADSADLVLQLKSFSEILVDYVSLGHFGLFERVLSGTERRNNILNIAREVYPEYSTTTDNVVAFNDQYDDTKIKININNLETDLSRLGEALAKRMEIEDKLCSVLLR